MNANVRLTYLSMSSGCFQVLDAGKIHAYDEPYTLLQDPEGIFYKMLQQTGKQEAAALMEAAKQVSSTCRTKLWEALLPLTWLWRLSRLTTVDPVTALQTDTRRQQTVTWWSSRRRCEAPICCSATWCRKAPAQLLRRLKRIVVDSPSAGSFQLRKFVIIAVKTDIELFIFCVSLMPWSGQIIPSKN